MGTWGTGILEDDFTRDVYDRYAAARGAGKSDDEAVRQLRSKCQADAADPDHGPLFWLAIAHAQWDVDQVIPDVLTQVDDIITSGLASRRQGLRAAGLGSRDRHCGTATGATMWGHLGERLRTRSA
jgi:hypothetical protein